MWWQDINFVLIYEQFYHHCFVLELIFFFFGYNFTLFIYIYHVTELGVHLVGDRDKIQLGLHSQLTQIINAFSPLATGIQLNEPLFGDRDRTEHRFPPLEKMEIRFPPIL